MRLLILLLALSSLTWACKNQKAKENTSPAPAITLDTLPERVNHRQEVHDQHDLHQFTEESQFDTLNDIRPAPIPVPKKKRHKDYKILGWHVYMNGTSYKSYNYKLLWAVGYFSYVVNPENGSYKSIQFWKTTKMIEQAHKDDCKVLLTVTNFGKKDNSTFLSNPKAQETLGDSLVALLALRNADGVNFDFEGVPSKYKAEYNNFLVNVSKKLKKARPDYVITVALYAVDRNKIFDIPTIDPYIDFYTLMGYDYYGSWSKKAGPVSPLTNSKKFGNQSVSHSVDYYLEQSVRPEKLILAVPYYGAQYAVEGKNIPYTVEKFKSAPPYKTTKGYYIDKEKVKSNFNDASNSSFLLLGGKAKPRQLWYDDTLALSKKYQLTKEKKLAGVGVWALGYDHGHQELWELLAKEFAQEEK